MLRALTLLKIAANSSLNRLRFDLARELVVLVSGGVVMATFAYIINDFLNVQVSGLSTVMRDRFAEPVAAAALLLGAFKAGAIIRNEWSGLSTPSRMAYSLGEHPKIIQIYRLLYSATILTTLHGISWWIVFRYLTVPTLPMLVAGELAMLVTTFLSGLWYRESSKDTEIVASSWLTAERDVNKLTSFVRWRTAQIALRNRTTRMCFIVALGLYLLLIPLQSPAIPFFASVACSILASIVATSALFFQVSEDLNYAWAERTMGISHDDFCRGYQKISLMMAVPLILVALLSFLTGHYLFNDGEFSLANAGTLALINLSTPVLAPMLMFQIDGRRPVINLILLTIAAMFIDTAIFANKLSLLLIPVLHYYAAGSQTGRFYRA